MKKYIILLCIIVLLILLSIPYVKVEILTHRYGEEFYDKYMSEGEYYLYILDIAYLKVYDYSECEATVYYMSIDKDFSIMVDFVRNNADSEWEFSGKWRHIYAPDGNGGSVFIWPYYR